IPLQSSPIPIMQSTSLLISSVLSVLLYRSSLPSPHYDETIKGYSLPPFKNVENEFRLNFAENFERDGASVAVYHKGELVVNLWGGYADTTADRVWKKDTQTLLFSATKGITAVCIALLVDQGKLRYDDLVVKFWPEYGANGKQNTTVEDVLTHKAGIPFLDERVDFSDIGTDEVRLKIERAKPAWIPGTASGYHAVTFGFILDELIKKVDGRDTAQFFREEIALKNELDLSIGVEKNKFHRQARITLPDWPEYVKDIIRDPRIIAMLGISTVRFDGIIEKITATHSWLNFGYDMFTLNDPDVASLPLSAVTGVGTAQDTAKLFSLLLQGKIISNSTLTGLHRPTLDTWHIEQVVLYPVMKGHGFFYDPHPTVLNAFTFGHPGYGGQNVHVDPINDLVVVYLSNGLKTGSGELCYPSQRLLRSVYASL
ncbi:lact-6, partial [Pristionchus pacificus]